MGDGEFLDLNRLGCGKDFGGRGVLVHDYFFWNILMYNLAQFLSFFFEVVRFWLAILGV